MRTKSIKLEVLQNIIKRFMHFICIL